MNDVHSKMSDAELVAFLREADTFAQFSDMSGSVKKAVRLAIDRLAAHAVSGPFNDDERPDADESANRWPPLNAAMRAVLTNENCVYATSDAIYSALAEAAGRGVSTDESAKPIYQRCTPSGHWLDATKAEFDSEDDRAMVRIVYPEAAPVASKAAVTLSDDEIKFCAVRIKALCMTRHHKDWVEGIETRIRGMLAEHSASKTGGA
ncbi:MAG: hypothetical protein WDN30_14315 [Pararobbsia sp.]